MTLQAAGRGRLVPAFSLLQRMRGRDVPAPDDTARRPYELAYGDLVKNCETQSRNTWQV
jgi:hypothetical protein